MPILRETQVLYRLWVWDRVNLLHNQAPLGLMLVSMSAGCVLGQITYWLFYLNSINLKITVSQI